MPTKKGSWWLTGLKFKSRASGRFYTEASHANRSSGRSLRCVPAIFIKELLDPVLRD